MANYSGYELYHHGIKGQKWGIRRFQNSDGTYTAAGKARRNTLAIRLANKIFRQAERNEPNITNDLISIVSSNGSKMHGLKNRLKTEKSLLRKIQTDSKQKGITVLQAANDIKDSIRYTVISDDSKFVNSYSNIKKTLESKGYKELRCRNYWDLYKKGLAKHKSVQSVFKNPDGYVFEVQFQTPSSQKAKDLKTPIYEERRKVGLNSERQLILDKKMDELAESVLNPINIYKIKSH